MKVRAVPFTAGGQIGAVGFTAEAPVVIENNDQGAGWGKEIVVPAEPQQLVGLAYTGFTEVVLYNGTDDTGVVVSVTGAAGTYSFNYEVDCTNGLFAVVTGTGSGSIWLA